jgi:hypothetical protein
MTYGFDDLPGEFVFPAEVPGRAAGAECASAGYQYLHLGAEFLHHGNYLLEGPYIRSCLRGCRSAAGRG